MYFFTGAVICADMRANDALMPRRSYAAKVSRIFSSVK